jgi:hypothetical protein
MSMFTIPREWEETAVIANGGTTSNAIHNVGSRYLGAILPTVTGTALAFTVCDSIDGTYVGLNNSSGAVTMTVASSKAYKLPDDLAPFPYFKLVMDAQGAERTIVIRRKS